MIDPRATLAYTPAQLLAMVARTEFREFSQHDWHAWAGCESEKPLIGEFTHPGLTGRVTTLVLDGATVNAIDAVGDDVDDYGGRMYGVRATD